MCVLLMIYMLVFKKVLGTELVIIQLVKIVSLTKLWGETFFTLFNLYHVLLCKARMPKYQSKLHKHFLLICYKHWTVHLLVHNVTLPSAPSSLEWKFLFFYIKSPELISFKYLGGGEMLKGRGYRTNKTCWVLDILPMVIVHIIFELNYYIIEVIYKFSSLFIYC